MRFDEKRLLGSTGLEVGPLGLASSYGAPASAFEKAFEMGCNYFYWGSMRKSGMRDAIRNICGKGKRDDIILVIQSYSRSALLMESFAQKALKTLGQDNADVLVLGWYNKLPSKRILEKAAAMKEKGLVRFLALSGHNRRLFPELASSISLTFFTCATTLPTGGRSRRSSLIFRAKKGPESCLTRQRGGVSSSRKK